jgi:hypothetical protein
LPRALRLSGCFSTIAQAGLLLRDYSRTERRRQSRRTWCRPSGNIRTTPGFHPTASQRSWLRCDGSGQNCSKRAGLGSRESGHRRRAPDSLLGENTWAIGNWPI